MWSGEIILLPTLNLTPPVTEQEPKTIAIDAMHHAVYAAGAGCVFDAIMQD